MSDTLVGAGADELERIATTLRSAADDLDAHAGAVTATLRAVAWVGDGADRFGSDWFGRHRPHITSTAEYVRVAATRLDRNAAEQRHASRAMPFERVGPPLPPMPLSPSVDPGGAATADRLVALLGGLGLARDQIEMAAELAARIRAAGGIGELVDVLASERFAAVLTAADQLLDVGSVIVDAAADFADHAHLAFDERILHALADTAVRFGLDEGMEVAAEWLAGAATAALLPGFGAVLAPFVGDIAGAIAGELMDVAVDAVDAATDVVDTVADAVVDTYRQVTEAIGVVADLAGAAVHVVGDAIDLTGSAADAVTAAGDVAVGTGRRVITSVAGALDPFD